jgi:DNA repair protein SbcC/Rad50
MRVAQDAQKQWNARISALPLLHKDEQRLWEKFRSTCNTVFEMRSSAREAVKAAAEADRAKHTEKIAELRALASQSDEKALQLGVSAIQAAWRGLPRPDRGAERQFDDALEAANKQLKHLRRDKARGAWRALAYLDTALTALEAMPGDPGLLAAAEAAKSACDAKLLTHSGIATRLKAALAGSRPSLAKGAPVKAELMIDLEMALDLSSPPDETAARRARQLAQLANAMKNRTARPEPTALFLDFLGTPGPVDQMRVERVVARL